MSNNNQLINYVSSLLKVESKLYDKKIYFTNIFSLIGAVTCLPYIFIYLVYGHYFIALSVLFFVGLFFLAWFLNNSGHNYWGKFILIFSANISIFSYSYIMGMESGLYIFLPAIIAASAIVYSISDKKVILFHLLISLILFFILEITSPHKQIIYFSETVLYIMYIMSFVSCTFVVFLCNYYQNSTNEEAEFALRKTQERNTALLNAVPDLIVRVSNDGNVLDFKSDYIHKSFIGAKEIIGSSISVIFPPELIKRIRDAIRRVIEENVIVSIEYKMEQGASIKNFEARFVKSGDSEAIVIIRDFTELKNIENQLKQSETNLRVLVENTIKSFVLLDRNFRILVYNSKAENIMRSVFKGEIEIGMNIDEPDNHSGIMKNFRKSYQDALRGISGKRYREIKMGNGESIFFEVDYIPAYDDQNNIYGVVISTNDITEIRRHELELEQAKHKAEDAAKAKSDFLSNMSHEMRTPLNAIIGFTDLLLQKNPTEELMENIQAIKYSSENLLVLINDILDLSKIESGKLSIENTDFNIKNLLDQIINLVTVKVLNKGIKLHFSIDDSIPLNLIGDPVRINQILLNIISNAVKFTNQGSVSVSVKLLQSDIDEVKIGFKVKDTGIGINENKLTAIFESFTQAESYITRKYGGTGLGLSITKKLVELLNGNIKVESTEGMGSIFTVEIPLKIGSNVEPSNEPEYEVYPELTGVKLLLVEDNIFNQLLIIQILSKWNIQVDKANNGVEAIILLRKNEYDLILMDMQMPEMNGFETAQHIRDPQSDVLNHEVPIIAISADAYNESKEMAIKAGMNDYITKPFRQNELHQLLVKYIYPSSDIIGKVNEEDNFERIEQTFNIDYLKQNVSVDEKILKKILSLYVSNTSSSIAAMMRAYQNNDMMSIKDSAHKMKSSFATIGFTNTVKILRMIEKESMENGDSKLLAELITIIDSDFNKSLEVVNKYIQTGTI